MSGVFRNIDPPTSRRVCNPPPLVRGGGHTCWVERGVGGQYFGRRQTQLCTLLTYVSTLWVIDSSKTIHSIGNCYESRLYETIHEKRHK
jgi:hypothetical protein